MTFVARDIRRSATPTLAQRRASFKKSKVGFKCGNLVQKHAKGMYKDIICFLRTKKL